MRRYGVALVAVVALAGTVAGCEQGAEDRRDAYCEQVREDAERLTRISDEGGPAGFLEALPVLEGLAEESPNDLRDEWQTFLNALRGLQDALEETDVDPAEMAGPGLPEDLTRAERRRIRAQASVLASAEVVSATQGIEQHALDICKTPIL